MPLALGDFYSSAAQQVGEYFREGAGQVADYYRDALRGADQLTGASGLAKETARLVCRRYGENPGVVSGAVSANFERLCRPYLDSIEAGEGPVVELPFRGGQCDAVYLLNISLFVDENTPIGTNTYRTRGPVAGVRAVDIPGSVPLSRSLQVGSFGAVNVSTGCGSAPNLGFAWRQIATANGGRIQLNSITPCGLDNCGNPPPVFTPPAPDPTPEPPGPRPIIIAPGVDIDVDVQIGPENVTIIGLGVGPVVIDPFPEGGGPGGGGPGGGGPPPGDVGSPGDPDDAGPGSPAAGCAPPNSVLAGIKVAILTAPAGVNQYDPLVWRGACYVYFGVPGNLALDPSGVALRDGQFFIPPAENLTCYEVRANTGFTLRVTPYYRPLEAEQV